MSKNGYENKKCDTFSDVEPLNYLGIDAEDFLICQDLPDDCKAEFLNNCRRLKDLIKKGIELDRQREAEEAAEDNDE